MNQVKYITIRSAMFDTAIVFGSVMGHNDVAKIFQAAGFTVLGAGFVDHEGKPYGRSTSLKIGPHEQDEFLLRYSMPHVLDPWA